MLDDSRFEDFDVHTLLAFVDRIAHNCDMTRDTASTLPVLAARTDEIQAWSAAHAAAERAAGRRHRCEEKIAPS